MTTVIPKKVAISITFLLFIGALFLGVYTAYQVTHSEEMLVETRASTANDPDLPASEDNPVVTTVRIPFNTSSFLTLLLKYAQVYSFFDRYHLEPVFDTTYTVGAENIAGLLAGDLDVAISSHSNFVEEALAGQNIALLANIAEARRHIGIIYKKDHISSISDLEGSTIALPLTTSADHFLDLFLHYHQIPQASITELDTNPNEIRKALERPEVHAAVIWNPTWTRLVQQNPTKYGVFVDDGIFTTYFVLLADAGRSNDIQYLALLKQVEAALQAASKDLQEHPEKATAILINEYNLERNLAEEIVASYTFEYAKPSRLLLSIQNELNWKSASQAGSVKSPFTSFMKLYEK